MQSLLSLRDGKVGIESMKEPERQDRDSPSPHSQEQSQDPLKEAHELFDRMSSEVMRRSKVGSKSAPSHGPVERFLLVLTIAACLFAVGTAIYGVYYFPTHRSGRPKADTQEREESHELRMISKTSLPGNESCSSPSRPPSCWGSATHLQIGNVANVQRQRAK